MCNVTYVPSASVNDCPEDRHCLTCLADPTATLTVMTMIPQLRTGNCGKQFMYTTKGPTYERGKNNYTHKQEPLMPIPRIRHAYWIQANTIKTTRTLQDIELQKAWHFMQSNPLITYKNKTPWSKTAQNIVDGQHSIWTSSLSTNKNKTSTLEIDCMLPQQASTYLQPNNKPIIKTIQPSPILSANENGPTKWCGRTKGAKGKQPRQANHQIMRE